MARRFARLCQLGKDSPMTATAEMPPPASGQNREFPVLFHLIDVSLPSEREREPSEPPPRKYELPIWDEPLAHQLADSSKELAEPKCEELNSVLPEPTGAESTFTATVTSDIAESTISAPERFCEASLNDTAAEEHRIKQPAELSAGAEPVTPAERKQSRRREQTASKGDWFASQGKYIAICFVLALAGTIYVARTGHSRPHVAQPPVTHAHPGDAGLATVKTEGAKPEIVVEAAGASNDKASSPAGGVTSSSAPAAEQASVEVAGVDLHPPTPPQLAQEDPTQPTKDQDSLFPWANRTEERVATRPEPLPAAASYEQPVPPQPQYPVTNYRGSYGPGEQHSSQSGGPSSTTSNPPTGYRHERTGSGLY